MSIILYQSGMLTRLQADILCDDWLLLSARVSKYRKHHRCRLVYASDSAHDIDYTKREAMSEL